MRPPVHAGTIWASVQPRVNLGETPRLAGGQIADLDSFQDVLRHHIADHTAHRDRVTRPDESSRPIGAQDLQWRSFQCVVLVSRRDGYTLITLWPRVCRDVFS